MRLALPRWRRGWSVDPRVEYERLMHVNEQTIRGLRRSVVRAGFRHPEVHLGKMVYTDFVSVTARKAYEQLARRRLSRPLAIADLWVHAHRP